MIGIERSERTEEERGLLSVDDYQALFELVDSDQLALSYFVRSKIRSIILTRIESDEERLRQLIPQLLVENMRAHYLHEPVESERHISLGQARVMLEALGIDSVATAQKLGVDIGDGQTHLRGYMGLSAFIDRALLAHANESLRSTRPRS